MVIRLFTAPSADAGGEATTEGGYAADYGYWDQGCSPGSTIHQNQGQSAQLAWSLMAWRRLQSFAHTGAEACANIGRIHRFGTLNDQH